MRIDIKTDHKISRGSWKTLLKSGVLGRGKSIVNDLKGFLKEHIVPLKKGEVVRGEPVKVCVNVKKEFFCTCWKLKKGRYYA